LLYNHEEKRDDLSKPNLLPYGITPSAPVIVLPDVELFKRNKSQTVKNHFQTKFEEIKAEYQKLLDQVCINDLLYKSRYSFVPLVGKTYYLYKVAEEDYILSLIEPDRWSKYEFIGAFKFSSNDVWVQE
jgi:hypothetical protein